jgi:transposase
LSKIKHLRTKPYAPKTNGKAERFVQTSLREWAYAQANLTSDLLPTLNPANRVVRDNLGSHKGKAVRALIRSRGAKLFCLPKYSPDLNPIEQVFAKLKHLLRKAAAQTVKAVWAAIGQLLAAFMPKECANYFENSICLTLNHPALVAEQTPHRYRKVAEGSCNNIDSENHDHFNRNCAPFLVGMRHC